MEGGGGLCARVCAAQLLRPAEVVFLDEITTDLDLITRQVRRTEPPPLCPLVRRCYVALYDSTRELPTRSHGSPPREGAPTSTRARH